MLVLIILITPCFQEHALDEVLSNLPQLSASNMASLSHFVETTYAQQSALANRQIEVRGQIAEQLQTLMQREVKGQIYHKIRDYDDSNVKEHVSLLYYAQPLYV